jgi:hypothetical protein
MTAFTGNVDTDIMWGGRDKAYVRLDVEEIEDVLKMVQIYGGHESLQKKLTKALKFFKSQKIK